MAQGFMQKAGCAAILVVVIVCSFLLGFSFYVIEPNNVAIDYNKVSQKLDLETLYQPGRIFLGVGHEMIVYPTIQMTRELHSQVGRTKDGLSVNFMCNYQFQYQKEITALSKIYLQYKGEHLSSFDFYAASVLRDTLATYTAFEVITMRPLLSSDMQTKLNEELTKYGVDVTAFQLLNIDLPVRFMNAIEQTVITQQNMEKATFTREKAKINGETKRLTAAIDAKLIKVTAEADATATLNEARATALGTKVQLDSEKSAYKELFDNVQTVANMGAFDKDHLLGYIRTEKLADSGAGLINVAVDQKVV
ncbi:hypothetical protein TrVE_jg12758 [Triparma verrucosa]|uniref:Prohibitin n=2 Tax=Triparma TaxID=722752 RepID=A0A9W7EPA2_9STRA|nr:hypothetical protein TrST_g11611 [Triparma strigata]GMH95794.1 hypothetical protein TrVE_jg12758 [Triparma verrucosa]